MRLELHCDGTRLVIEVNPLFAPSEPMLAHVLLHELEHVHLLRQPPPSMEEWVAQQRCGYSCFRAHAQCIAHALYSAYRVFSTSSVHKPRTPRLSSATRPHTQPDLIARRPTISDQHPTPGVWHLHETRCDAQGHGAAFDASFAAHAARAAARGVEVHAPPFGACGGHELPSWWARRCSLK